MSYFLNNYNSSFNFKNLKEHFQQQFMVKTADDLINKTNEDIKNITTIISVIMQTQPTLTESAEKLLETANKVVDNLNNEKADDMKPPDIDPETTPEDRKQIIKQFELSKQSKIKEEENVDKLNKLQINSMKKSINELKKGISKLENRLNNEVITKYNYPKLKNDIDQLFNFIKNIPTQDPNQKSTPQFITNDNIYINSFNKDIYFQKVQNVRKSLYENVDSYIEDFYKNQKKITEYINFVEKTITKIETESQKLAAKKAYTKALKEQKELEEKRKRANNL